MADYSSIISTLNDSGIDCTDKQKNMIKHHHDLQGLSVALYALKKLINAQTIAIHLDKLLAHKDLSSVEINLDALFHLSQEKAPHSNTFLLSEKLLVPCVDAILYCFSDWRTMLLLRPIIELQEPDFIKNPCEFINKIKLLNSEDKNKLMGLLNDDLSCKEKKCNTVHEIQTPESLINQPLNLKSNLLFFPTVTTHLQEIVFATVKDIISTQVSEDILNIEWKSISNDVIQTILIKEKLSNSPMTHFLINRYGQAALNEAIQVRALPAL